MITMKTFLYKYRHAAALLYFPFYIGWFLMLANRGEVNWHMIESPLDSYIPFVEAFIVPYLLWFPFVPAVLILLFFKSREAFCRCITLMFSGMTISLFLFTVYPTAIDFRPVLSELGRENIFTRLANIIFSTDPGTNVLPSIHCFNSLALMVAVREEECTKHSNWLRIGTTGLTIAICLSTVFIKQHSVIDVGYALLMTAVLYMVVYLPHRLKRKASVKLATATVPAAKVKAAPIATKSR